MKRLEDHYLSTLHQYFTRLSSNIKGLMLMIQPGGPGIFHLWNQEYFLLLKWTSRPLPLPATDIQNTPSSYFRQSWQNSQPLVNLRFAGWKLQDSTWATKSAICIFFDDSCFCCCFFFFNYSHKVTCLDTVHTYLHCQAFPWLYCHSYPKWVGVFNPEANIPVCDHRGCSSVCYSAGKPLGKCHLCLVLGPRLL